MAGYLTKYGTVLVCVVLTLLVLAVGSLAFTWFRLPSPIETVDVDINKLNASEKIEVARLQVEQFKLRQELLQIMVVGVAVGLAAIVFPILASQRRDKFQRYKESRKAYSRAKTGVRYLPERLAALDYSEAIQLINEVHEYHHMAETYDELRDQLNRRRLPEHRDLEAWSKNMYNTIKIYTAVVSKAPDRWSYESRKTRLTKLHEALTALKKTYNEEEKKGKATRILHLTLYAE